MKFSRIASALAAASLLVAPIAAQAGTRASASTVYPTESYSASRVSSSVGDENSLTPLSWILILLGFGAGAFGIAKAIDSKSSGAN